MTLPIYELKISEDINNEAEVSYVALVDEPAIKKDFIAFKDEFIAPSKGEQKIEFLPRCISYVIKEGKDTNQAVAICNSMWSEHFAIGDTCPLATQDIATNLKDRQNAIDVAHYGPLNPNLPSEEYWTKKAKQFNATIEEAKQSVCGNCSFFNVSQKIKDCIANGIGNELDPYNVIDAGDLGYCEAFDFKCAAKRTCDAWVVGGPIQEFAESYNDYPKEASKNAQIALDYADKNGWGSCGTPVGKIRANQLAKGESISRETIARMSAFERQRQNSDKPLGDGCGRLMWLAWGGDAGIEWAKRKLEQIDKGNFVNNKISFDYDDTLSTERGKTLAKRLITEGNTIYIISARDSKDGMLSTASDLGIPESRVYATGSNSAKVQKVKDLNINKHYDNNADVIAQLDGIGAKFLESHSFAIVDEEQRIISGALMIADELIYRNNEKFGEHYVKFSAETIKQIAIKFAKKKYQNHVNLMHDSEQRVNDVTMFESFIVDKKRGIMPMAEFKDVADGSWFGSFYVENDEVWNEVKKGTYRGFSVEGMFDYVEPISAEENALQQISKLLNELITN
jgi:hypothetical protein